MWGGWLLVTGLTFSFASGIIHPYYTVALAPAVGGVVGIGAVSLWHARTSWLPRAFLATAVVAAAWWSYALLDRSSNWLPELRVFILIAGIGAAAGILFLHVMQRQLALGVVGVALAASLAGPLAYSVNTARTAHEGSIPSAGPAVSGASFDGGRGGGGTAPGGTALGGTRGQNGFGPGQGTLPGATGQVPGALGNQGGQTGTRPSFGGGAGGTGGTGGGNAGGAGGLLNASTPSAELVSALQADASSYTWVLAITGANSAAGYQLASGEPVMAIGGFNGTDPTPTLAQFESYVDAGKIHYYIAGGGGLGGGGGGGTTSSYASQIATWVAANFNTTTIGGTTVYDLTSPKA